MRRIKNKLIVCLCVMGMVFQTTPVSFAQETEQAADVQVAAVSGQDTEEIPNAEGSAVSGQDAEEKPDTEGPAVSGQDTDETPDAGAAISGKETKEAADVENADASAQQTEDPAGKTVEEAKPEFKIAQEEEAEPIDITSDPACVTSLSQTSYVYNGAAQTPTARALYNNVEMAHGVDYDVIYANNINAGTATVTVAGKGKYKGTRNMDFTITPAPQTLTASASPSKFMFKKTSKMVVKSSAGASAGKFSYKSSNTKIAAVNPSTGLIKGKYPGKAVITVTAAGSANYASATAKVNIQVKGYELKKSTTKFTLSRSSYTYDGKYKKPSVTVKYKGKKIKKNKDYKVTYANNKNAGKATVTITGKGYYTGSMKKTFTIKKADNNFKVSISKTQIQLHKTAQIKVKKAYGEVTFKSSNKSVASVDEDGTVTSKKNGHCTISVTADGDLNHVKKTKKIKIECGNLKIDKASVSLSRRTYTYDGESKRPSATVRLAGRTLKRDRDYTVTYYDNTNAGKARMVLKGKGDYSGTKIVTFTIKKATQKAFTARLTQEYLPLNGRASVFVSGGRGKLTYGTNSPSYAKHLGDGVFTGLKETHDTGISLWVKAAGDSNYASKTIEIRVQVR